jgi:ectoine hydroxylase-related dioxygenase (phytanoyl-CoA dioxygenase family)
VSVQAKPTIRHIHVSENPDVIFEALLADGTVIVEGFLTDTQVAAVNEEVGPFIEAADPTMEKVYDFDMGLLDESIDQAYLENGFKTRKTKNITALTGKSPTFASDVLVHPTYMAMCDRLLQPHCQHYVLNHSHIINPGPGAHAQPLHRDEGVFAYVPQLGVGSHLQFASIVALVDFTEENGATQVVPGSHLWPGDPFGQEGRAPQPEEVTQAAMPAGSAVLYLGWTFHGAGENRTSDTWRRGLHVSYCQGWLRTEENNTLATPPDVARHLPEKAQELLGYGVHAGTGMLELRRPIDQMKDGFI